MGLFFNDASILVSVGIFFMHQFDTAGIFTLFFESKMPSSWSSVLSSTVQPIVYYLCFSNSHGWSGGVMVLGKLPAPGCPTNLDCSGATRQGPTALAVGAGGGCLDIFSLICHFSFLSPSLWEMT